MTAEGRREVGSSGQTALLKDSHWSPADARLVFQKVLALQCLGHLIRHVITSLMAAGFIMMYIGKCLQLQ